MTSWPLTGSKVAEQGARREETELVMSSGVLPTQPLFAMTLFPLLSTHFVNEADRNNQEYRSKARTVPSNFRLFYK